MGFLDKLKQATGVYASLQIIAPDAGTEIEFEWLRGRLSAIAVGESHH